MLSQEASHGQWVALAGGTHNFTAGQDYTVELTQTNTENGFCKYQMADQMKWVYDGASTKPPVNTSPPTISGEVQVGKTLTESHGKWTESPSSYIDQWEDCDSKGGSCLPISGANSQSYTVAESDVGHTMVLQETATNAAGSSSPAASAPTALVTSAATKTSPTTTNTTTSPHPTEPSSPDCTYEQASGATSGQPPKQAASLHKRIIAGAQQLIHARSVRVALNVTLCGKAAQLTGVKPGTELTGTGTVDFAHQRAQWSIKLSEALGGHTLTVISHRGQTFLLASSLELSSRHPWIRIGSRELAKLPRLGFLGVLAAFTNPAAGVGVVQSTSSTVTELSKSAAFDSASLPDPRDPRAGDATSAALSCIPPKALISKRRVPARTRSARSWACRGRRGRRRSATARGHAGDQLSDRYRFALWAKPAAAVAPLRSGTTNTVSDAKTLAASPTKSTYSRSAASRRSRSLLSSP